MNGPSDRSDEGKGEALRIMPTFRLPVALFAIVAMVLALAFAIGASSSRQGNKDAAPPISIAINLRQDAIISDSETPLEVTITNISNRDQNYGPYSSPVWMEEYHIDIRDCDGKPAAEKPILTRINGPLPSIDHGNGTSETIVRGSSGPFFVLKPGEQMGEQVLLNRLYDLSKPGKYTIRARMGVGPRIYVTSNTIIASFAKPAAPARGAKPAISMTLKAPYNLVRAGYQVPVELAVKNISKHEITWAAWRGQHEYGPGIDDEFGTGIVVCDSRGNPVPLTKSGRVLLSEEYFLDKDDLHAPENDLPKGGFAFLRMRPGEIREERKTVAGLYDLSRPGIYTIQASRLDPTSHLLVKSNPITVTVVGTDEKVQQGTLPPFWLFIGTFQDTIKAGSSLQVYVSMMNMSDDVITSSYSNPGLDAEVHDSQGKEPPLTRRGQLLRQQFRNATSGPEGFPVRPGKSISGHVIYLDELYDLRRPGRYTIQVGRFDEASKIIVKSNKSALTVTE
jgi:hypothetical protein